MNIKYDIKEYFQEKYNDWFCAICSIAIADSEMYNTRMLPDTVYSLMKRWKGLNENNEVIWRRTEWIFNILSDVHLYADKHYDLNIIKPPAILSIDGNKFKKGYQSHFRFLRSIKITDNKVIGDIFCPIQGNIIVELKKNEIYSIINLRKGN